MQDILQLGQCEKYTLQAEKVKGKWWLELIERSTGMTWILHCDTKKHAQKIFERMTMEECRTVMEKFLITPIKMYKQNVM